MSVTDTSDRLIKHVKIVITIDRMIPVTVRYNIKSIATIGCRIISEKNCIFKIKYVSLFVKVGYPFVLESF